MDIREEVREWLQANWDPERPLREWRGLLADSGWGCPAWPVGWFGRDLGPDQARIVEKEFESAGAVGVALGVGMSLAAPTILTHGSDEIKHRFLRGIITGEDRWCQLFSEPGNGSDLAGLTTHAALHEDEWIVNGQKVWNTGAHHAEYGLLVARTDWDVPKHRGITYFVLPMKQPGIEVRPLRQMNGYSSFNEVFMTDARVPNNNVIGELHGGWPVAMTTLSNERGLATLRLPKLGATATGRTATEAMKEATEYFATYVWYPQRAGRPDLVIAQAQALGRNNDPVVRQHIADLVAFEKAAKWTVERASANRKAGGKPGPEGSIAKLCGSEIARKAARVHAEIVGASGMIAGPDGPAAGVIPEVILSVPGQSIAGGTDEIQRNIVAERVLGLPKEPQVDRDVPFREVRTNRG